MRGLTRATSISDLSILIVTYHSREVILDCLEALKADRTSARRQIVLVDNGSSDGVPEVVAAGFPHIQVIANATNRGFPTAVNQAASQAHGRYLLLLNPDALIEPDSVWEMVAWMDCHPEVGACGPQICYTDGQEQPSVLPLPTLFNVFWSFLGVRRRYQLDMVRPTLFAHGVYLLGACLLVRRVTWDQIGPLDEQLFWIEDADWALRAQQQGWQLAYLPQVSATHIGEASARKDVFVKLTRQHLNKLGFFEKHGTRVQQSIMRLIILLVAGTRFVVQILHDLFASSPEECERLAAYRHVIGVTLGLEHENWN